MSCSRRIQQFPRNFLRLESPQLYLAGNTKGGKYHGTIDLLFYRFEIVCFVNKTKIVSCHTADSKPVKQEVNGTVILPPLAFPVSSYSFKSMVLTGHKLLLKVTWHMRFFIAISTVKMPPQIGRVNCPWAATYVERFENGSSSLNSALDAISNFWMKIILNFFPGQKFYENALQKKTIYAADIISHVCGD